MMTQSETDVITPYENILVAPESDNHNDVSLGKAENKSWSQLKICKGSKLYACPKKGCPRNAESLRKQFFPDLYRLKMHYQTVHGEKKFKCEKCSRTFGNNQVFKHHNANCNTDKLYTCECGGSYKTRNALLTHARRKQHTIEERKNVSESTNVSKTYQNATVSNIGSSMLVASDTFEKAPIHFPRLIRILPAKNVRSNVENNRSHISANLSEPINSVHTNPIVMMRSLDTMPPSTSVCNKSKELKHGDRLHSSTGSDNYNKINLSAKNIAKTFTQTSAHLKFVKSPPLKKANMVTQTVNLQDININKNGYDLKRTMDTQTQIDLSEIENKLFMATSNTQTDDFPETVSIDTQTNVNFYHFVDKILRSTSDTQTEGEFSVNNAFIPQKSCIDTQTQITLYQFDGMKANIDTQTDFSIPIQTTNIRNMSSMDTQTKINSINFNDIIKKLTMDTQTDFNFENFSKKQTVEAETQMNYVDETTEVLETSDASVQCQGPYFFNNNLPNDCYLVSDNETQTDPISKWLNSFSNQDLSDMETQTNFTYSNPIQGNFDVEPLLLDKSVQLEDMVELSDTYGMIPVGESSNISTQTVKFPDDPWMIDNLVCESSSTQTDFLGDFDLTDIDFTVDKEVTPEISQANRYCSDVLISGNTLNESMRQERNTIETQTTISLYDLLNNSLISNYFNIDKSMSNIETQTAEEYSDIFIPHRSNIETQTDYFN